MSFSGSKTVNIASESTSLANPITFYKEKTGTYPSNSQVWWAMKRPPEVGTDKAPKIYLEVFDPSMRYQLSTGNTRVARGHFILEAFNKDRSAVSGISGFDVESANGARPAAVAFYSGRVFYAGAFASGVNTTIYFSPIIERPEQIAQCYQEADPTAEDINQLQPSDGGTIIIPDVVKVVKMQVYGSSLFVFADNGVWQIGGQQGFRANDYSVSKLSSTPALSSLSFVDVEGAPIWWNRSAISSVVPDQTGNLTVQSLTEKTIKQFYDDIPEQSKFYAKGAYDAVTRRVQWLYRSTETDDNSEIFNYDKILVLDTVSGAFYPWSVDTASRVVMKGIFAIEGETVTQSDESVVSNSVSVLSNTVEVTSTLEQKEIIDSKIKYIVNVLSDETSVPTPPAAALPTAHQIISNSVNVQSNSVDVVETF